VAAAPITVMVADDHTVMRNGLRLLLEEEDDLHVVAEAGDIDSVFRHVRAQRPQVLVLDLNMPGGSSVAAIGRLARMAPGMAVVVLTMDDDPASARAAFDAGASAYVLKDAASTDLANAIRKAAAA
jgi:two-component system, NarL family, response regulator NreC